VRQGERGERESVCVRGRVEEIESEKEKRLRE